MADKTEILSNSIESLSKIHLELHAFNGLFLIADVEGCINGDQLNGLGFVLSEVIERLSATKEALKKLLEADFKKAKAPN